MKKNDLFNAILESEKDARVQFLYTVMFSVLKAHLLINSRERDEYAMLLSDADPGFAEEVWQGLLAKYNYALQGDGIAASRRQRLRRNREG